jgi:hypothetical protein
MCVCFNLTSVIGAKGAKPPVRPSDPQAEAFEPAVDQSLKEITLETSDLTININRWNAVKDNLSVSQDIEPTQATLIPMQWWHLPIVDNRAFEVVSVESVTRARRRFATGSTTKLARDAQGNHIEEQVESWEITVQNSNIPLSTPIVLYASHHPPTNEAHVPWRAGALETRFCDKDAADRVADQVCQRLDRLPEPVDPDLWNITTNNPMTSKVFLEAAAIFAIDPEFDHTLVDPLWLKGPTKGGKYEFVSGAPVFDPKRPERWKMSVYGLSGERYTSSFSSTHLDPDKVRKELVNAVPDNFYFVSKPVPYDAKSPISEAQHEAANTFHRYVQFATWDMHFDQTSLNTWMRRCIEEYTLPREQRKYHRTMIHGAAGPCNGSNAWTVEHRAGQPTSIRPMKHLSDVIEGGELPDIRLNTDDDVVISHVLQAMSLELCSRSGILNAWQAGIVAADIANVYMPQVINRETMIENHCLCVDDAERQEVSHYCMHDLRYVRCCNGIKLHDGRFVCTDCAPEGVLSAPQWLGSALLQTIRRSCYSGVKRDCDVRGLPVDLDAVAALREHCNTFVIDVQKGIWQDGYDGPRNYADVKRTYRDVVSCSHGLLRSAAHFLLPSVDHVLPLAKAHVPDNCVVTTLGANRLRGPQPSYVLWLMSEGRRHWLAEQEGEPRDKSFWASFYTALDHAMFIVRMAPGRYSTRVSKEPSKEKLESIAACCKSGEFVGSTYSSGFLTISDFAWAGENVNNWKQASHVEAAQEWRDRGGRKEWEVWDDQAWDVILRIHTEIESSPVYNPHNIRMPLGPGGHPYPYAISHMPSKSTSKHYRDFLCNEHIWRWRRMDEKCNWAWITKNSPKTLFLAFLIWWYSTGGLDKVFGCPLTFYLNHMCTVSIGRGPEVDPGSELHDGWTTADPTFLTQYDPELRTLTFQAAATNRLWGNSPKEYLAGLADCVLANIRPTTDHYDAIKSNMPAIQFPEDIANRELGKISRDEVPYDDFFEFFGRDGQGDGASSSDSSSASGSSSDPDSSSDLDDESDVASVNGEDEGGVTTLHEIVRFTRRIHRGERLEFNLPALALLERAQELELGLEDENNDLRAAWVVSLAKGEKDGERAWTHDDMNTWILDHALGDSTPPGTVVLPTSASNYFAIIEDERPAKPSLQSLGNPLNDTRAQHARGTINKAVMIYCSGSHYVVLAFHFNRESGTGTIEYWNSLPTKDGKGNLNRTRKLAPVFGAFLSRQPQIDMPNLDWTGEVLVREQTHQGTSTINCGPLSINTLINAVQNKPTEVVFGNDVVTLSFRLRHRYLTWGFEQYMGVPSMTDFIRGRLEEVEVEVQRRQEERAERQRLRQVKKIERERRRQEKRAEQQRRREAKAEAERQRREGEEAEVEAERQRREEAAAQDNGLGGGVGDEPQNPSDNLTVRMGNMEGLMRTLLERFDNIATTTNQALIAMTKEIKAVRTQINTLPPGRRQQPPVNPGPGSSAAARIVPRNVYTPPVVRGVEEGHPAYRYAVVIGIGTARQVGYAADDGGFFTRAGDQIARHDDEGNITLLDGQLIGNYMDFADV